MSSRLQEFRFVHPQEVTWGDMDALGHVNNTVYFRYLENARLAYFLSLDGLQIMHRHGCGPVLADTRCRFRKPVRYPAHLQIGVRVEEMSQDRLRQVYHLVRQSDDQLVAEAEASVVCVGLEDGRPRPWPEELRQAMQARENPFC